MSDEIKINEFIKYLKIVTYLYFDHPFFHIYDKVKIYYDGKWIEHIYDDDELDKETLSNEA